MAKKLPPARKSTSSKKRVKKAATVTRAGRKPAAARRTSSGGVNFNPVKKQLKAHIAKLEKQLGGSQARATAVDQGGWDTLDQLKALNQQLSFLCQPTMVIPNT